MLHSSAKLAHPYYFNDVTVCSVFAGTGIPIRQQYMVLMNIYLTQAVD